MTKMLAAISILLPLSVLSADSTAELTEGLTGEFSETRNLYFGDTHVHTSLSFDAYLFGNRSGLEDAYRFAKGEAITLATGNTTQLSTPLDFVVMADHAESFGLFETCSRDTLNEKQRKYCTAFDTPSMTFFLQLRNEGVQRPPKRLPSLCEDDMATCLTDSRTTWDKVRAAADAHNEPGQFTAFSGYEYSPPLKKRGKIHRNVIFRNSTTPDRVVSAFDAETVLDLWKTLEAECTGECEFLTIPHNMNKTWDIAYSGKTIDGDSYEDKDWGLRRRSEPLAEIFQIKGSSECGYDLGASDEECHFERLVPLCPKVDGEIQLAPGCSGRLSFAREGLKEGLKLERTLGFNPLQFGFIGSTDTHNSTAGATEEFSYIGASTHEASAKVRLGLNTVPKNKGKLNRNPGGLAAVWATENTRDAIFDSMQRRETYATSGTRIKLRFFAGWHFEQALLEDSQWLDKAYRDGVPMGDVLAHTKQKENTNVAPEDAPEFLIWALKDAKSSNLQRVQMIKGWVENGESKESVFDIACADGLSPNAATGRCPDNGARVDIANCTVSPDKGAGEIKTRWRDPDFNADQSAFYYIRVLENPSCRWSTFDANALGVTLPKNTPATIQERAWSSPIWYTP